MSKELSTERNAFILKLLEENDRLRAELQEARGQLEALGADHKDCAEHFRRLLECDKHIDELEAELREARESSGAMIAKLGTECQQLESQLQAANARADDLREQLTWAKEPRVCVRCGEVPISVSKLQARVGELERALPIVRHDENGDIFLQLGNAAINLLTHGPITNQQLRKYAEQIAALSPTAAPTETLDSIAAEGEK